VSNSAGTIDHLLPSNSIVATSRLRRIGERTDQASGKYEFARLSCFSARRPSKQLHNIFRKIDVASRVELAQAVGRADRAPHATPR
jgi:hypothetical protein